MTVDPVCVHEPHIVDKPILQTQVYLINSIFFQSHIMALHAIIPLELGDVLENGLADRCRFENSSFYFQNSHQKLILLFITNCTIK